MSGTEGDQGTDNAASPPSGGSCFRMLAKLLAVGAGLVLGWLVLAAAQIAADAKESKDGPADAAIVLGAAVRGTRPSPVFEQRIRHALHLHRAGSVRKLIFTGGRGYPGAAAEAAVGRAYALSSGVPAGDILIETRSHTTHENIVEARHIMLRDELRTALVVSDPLHMKRAMRMAHDLGIEAQPAPTPTSRYRGALAKARFLAREAVFYTVYLITGR